MKSILIIGLGRFGSIMAERLENEGNTVLGVDISEKEQMTLLAF